MPGPFEINSSDFFWFWLVGQVVTCLVICLGYQLYHRGG